MTWRIVQVSSNSKLELKLNYLVVRTTEYVHKVYIPEIAVLIIENTAVSLTAALLCELSRNKIKIIFCDERRNPYGELLPYCGSHDCVGKLLEQIKWDKPLIANIWCEIICQKIMKQAEVLIERKCYPEADLLESYRVNVKPGDVTNREGLAAKVYFNGLFGKDFSRHEDNYINSALNYGYAILLSIFSREITISGYSTKIGIFHNNNSNPFNLASDLMESFRPLVDRMVIKLNPQDFGPNEKMVLVNLPNIMVRIDGKQNTLLNTVRLYVQSFFDSVEYNDVGRLKTYEAEIHEGNGIF